MAADTDDEGLAAKIARLVEERGWNQEDFARITNLNRQTIRQILLNTRRKPHNATVQACARALGLSVTELRSLPLDRLLPRMTQQAMPAGEETLRRLYESATRPELRGWIERNEERARLLSAEEVTELLRIQDSAAALGSIGVERFVELLERRRRLMEKVRIVAGSEYLDSLETMIGLMYDRIQSSMPPGNR